MQTNNLNQQPQGSYSAKDAIGFLMVRPQAMIFPILGAAIWIAWIFAISHYGFIAAQHLQLFSTPSRALLIIPIFLLALILLTLIPIIIKTAMFYYVLANLQQQRCSIFNAFSRSLSRLPALLGWSAIVATIGAIFNGIENSQRSSWTGGLLGFSWSICTYLVLPIMVLQNVGPIKAIKQGITFGRNRTTKYVTGDLLLIAINTVVLLLCFSLAFLLIYPGLAQPYLSNIISHFFNTNMFPPQTISIFFSVIFALAMTFIISNAINCVVKSIILLNLSNTNDI